jgi:hypothetical protein
MEDYQIPDSRILNGLRTGANMDWVENLIMTGVMQPSRNMIQTIALKHYLCGVLDLWEES